MIAPGTILMEKDTAHPQCFQLEDGPYPHAWVSVKHNLTSYELEEVLVTAGWRLCDKAGAIMTTSFGFDRVRMMNAALKRVIARVRQQKCNCLEIDDVETHSFLGIPYVSVSAHARQIQKSASFVGDKGETQ
jgi:hypothetical protein